MCHHHSEEENQSVNTTIRRRRSRTMTTSTATAAVCPDMRPSLPVQLRDDPSLSDIHMAARRLVYFWIRQYLKDVMFKKREAHVIGHEPNNEEQSCRVGSMMELTSAQEKQLDDASTFVERNLYKHSFSLEDLLNRITLRRRIKRVVKSLFVGPAEKTKEERSPSQSLPSSKKRKATDEKSARNNDNGYEPSKLKKHHHEPHPGRTSGHLEQRKMERQPSQQDSVPSLSSEEGQEDISSRGNIKTPISSPKCVSFSTLTAEEPHHQQSNTFENPNSMAQGGLINNKR